MPESKWLTYETTPERVAAQRIKSVQLDDDGVANRDGVDVKLVLDDDSEIKLTTGSRAYDFPVVGDYCVCSRVGNFYVMRRTPFEEKYHLVGPLHDEVLNV
jgi:hypothetical protein